MTVVGRGRRRTRARRLADGDARATPAPARRRLTIAGNPEILRVSSPERTHERTRAARDREPRRRQEATARQGRQAARPRTVQEPGQHRSQRPHAEVQRHRGVHSRDRRRRRRQARRPRGRGLHDVVLSRRRGARRRARCASCSTAAPAPRRSGCTWARSDRSACVIREDGTMPPPPYTVTDNQESWFEHFDLVFIDPPHTGYSITASEDARKKMLTRRRRRRRAGRMHARVARRATAAGARRSTWPARATARRAARRWPTSCRTSASRCRA